MKISTYNVYFGGFNPLHLDATVPPRLGLIKEAITQINADFIGINEGFRWGTYFKDDREIADFFGFKKAFIVDLDDARLKSIGHNTCSLALTNIENVEFFPISLGTRMAIKANLTLNGRRVDVFVVYLDDISEDVRITQIERLEEELDLHKPTIVMGDLNTFSKKDEAHSLAHWQAVRENASKTLETFNTKIQDMLRAEVIEKLLGLGFTDASPIFIPTAPTDLVGKKLGNKRARVDYILYKDLMVKDFEVYVGQVFNEASDHYPISVYIS